MKRGAWHQMADRSQKLVLEQLATGTGVGVIISPRDLAKSNATSYASSYREQGASVLYDPQFHIPSYTNSKVLSYPSSQLRGSVSTLNQIGETELGQLAVSLKEENSDLQTDAIIAPAVVYEAGRPDIVELNRQLFLAAKAVGDGVGKPTYSTVFLGSSVTSSRVTIESTLSDVTSLDCDGWYFGFEFPPERVPSDVDYVYRCLWSGLMLACTGRPVLHAYAGPMGVLSHGFGATGAAIGHSQNVWHFSRMRFEPPAGMGGGAGHAPPRHFSKSLWGTIVFPDEVALLSEQLREQVLTESPFSADLVSGIWSRWDANKHLINVICSTVDDISESNDVRKCIGDAEKVLSDAVSLHQKIRQELFVLRDGTDAYQKSWLEAVAQLLELHGSDLDYLEMVK